MTRGIWVSETEFRAFAEGGQQGLGQHIATRLRAGDLGGLFGLLPNPDPILRRMNRSIETYSDLLVDPLVKGGRRRRRAAVVAMERGFERGEATGRLVRNLQAVLDEINLSELIRGLVDGAMFGYAVAEVIWGRVGALTVPVQVVCKPQQWFGFDPETQALRFKPAGSLKGEAVPERKFIVVGNGRSYANPYGEADLASCFWPVAFKRGGLRFWSTFTEKYGSPWAVGKQPRGSGQPEADALADKLAAMIQDAVAVIPDDSSVELLTVNTAANAELYEKLLMYCSREISIALLGNNQSVEMQSNRASATAAAGVEAELRDADAEMVADGLNQLVRWICQVNWPSAQPPRYEFWEQEEVDATQAERDQKLSQAGVRFTNAYWTRAYNLQDGDLAEQPDPAAAAQPVAAGRLRLVQRGQAGQADQTNSSDAARGVAATAQLAEGDAEPVPADQAAIDAALAQLPADEIQAAVEALLRPALAAVQAADTPDAAMTALAEAYPTMDATALQRLLERAFFVADVVGRIGVQQERA